ncbi:MAG: protein phosphatase 2C domain-containing protein [Sulfitobacter sp.]
MWKSPEPRFDVASAICQGGRDYQEDAIITDFPAGTDIGVVVLADGMGGHAAGDVASKLVVTEVFSDLKFESANFSEFETDIPKYLNAAAANANQSVRDYVNENPTTRGMGATLVALIMVENRMYWVSIGDSPLFHMRKGNLEQINEDHSMAPQIDFMVNSGLIDAQAGRDHPDRNCLTSVIMGEKVAKSDCPNTPFQLEIGDIVVVSSDGLQYLEDAQIEKILRKYRRKKSAEIAEHLLAALRDLADVDQDNISFAVVKLNHNKPIIQPVRQKPVQLVNDITAGATRVAASEFENSSVEQDPQEISAKAAQGGK